MVLNCDINGVRNTESIIREIPKECAKEMRVADPRKLENNKTQNTSLAVEGDKVDNNISKNIKFEKFSSL